MGKEYTGRKTWCAPSLGIPRGPKGVCRICLKPTYAKDLDEGLICRDCRKKGAER